ncbi:MAG: acyl carrier protein [Succinivibrionaceae bacterium]|nr:acyl carrier protein [Succinivibrionaceae bacterium]MDY6274264.1 acyl carrier protein [Succinivibrionaceae bacterium]
MNDVETEVAGIVADVCEVPESSVKPESSAGDFEKWDSMGHLAILREVSAKFGISFDFNEMMSVESVSDIVSAVRKKAGRP